MVDEYKIWSCARLWNEWSVREVVIIKGRPKWDPQSWTADAVCSQERILENMRGRCEIHLSLIQPTHTHLPLVNWHSLQFDAKVRLFTLEYLGLEYAKLNPEKSRK